MSTKTQIDRIETAKADIKAAIEGKGVTVPSTTKIDGMAALIESISGGKPEQTKTVTPQASAQTVTPDDGYTLSAVTVQGDADLVADNIKSGVDIFGVTGTYEGSGGGSGGLETCKLIMSYTATDVIYQPALGEYIYWKAEAPGDSIVGADVLCGSLISGVSYNATAENAVRIAINTWLVTAPPGGTVRFS